MSEKHSTETIDNKPESMWGPILTIKVSQSGTLWAAWTDDVFGVLVHGHSLAEVLEKFPAAKEEVERARQDDQPQRTQREIAHLIDIAVECWHDIANTHDIKHCNCFLDNFTRRLIDLGIFIGYDKL